MIERRLTFRLDSPPPAPDADAQVRRAAAWHARWRVLRRHAAILLLTLAVVGGAGAWWSYTRPPEYQTEAELFITARLQISDTGNALLNAVDIATRVRSVATVVNILRTRDIYDDAFAAMPAELRRAGFGAERLSHYPARVVSERDNDVVTIVVHAHTPDAAERFTREILAAEERRRHAFNASVLALATGQVEANLTRCETERARVAAEFAAVKRAHGVIDIRVAARAAVDTLAARQAAVTAAETAHTRARAVCDTLARALVRLPRQVVAQRRSEDNPLLTAITGEINRLQGARTRALQEYLPTAPEVQRLDEELASARQRLATATRRIEAQITEASAMRLSLERRYARAQAAARAAVRAVAIARTQRDRVQHQMARLPAVEQQLVRLQRRLLTLMGEHAYLTAQRSALSLRAAHGGLPEAIQLARRIPPARVSGPPRLGYLTAFLTLGLALGVGLALLRERGETQLRDTATLFDLAALPPVRVPRALAAPLEPYRLLRNPLLLGTTRVVLITSAGAGEGKSTTAAGLARACALAQRRVLLIDADLRHPCQHVRFGTPDAPGVSDILERGVPLDACLHTIDGVTLLPAGLATPSVPELLASTACADLITACRMHFDVVILDCPPLLALSDTHALLASVDGVVFVTTPHARRADVRAAFAVLHDLGATVLGVVLNKA
jgi:capsular exopolysaccharide synthesis family protein